MQEILNSDQRLVILRSLVECGDSANESILQTCLQTYGHRVSRDTVRTLLAWLREQGLVTLSDVSGCYVAGITGRGEDVAFGLATVPGVKTTCAGVTMERARILQMLMTCRQQAEQLRRLSGLAERRESGEIGMSANALFRPL